MSKSNWIKNNLVYTWLVKESTRCSDRFGSGPVNAMSDWTLPKWNWLWGKSNQENTHILAQTNSSRFYNQAPQMVRIFKSRDKFVNLLTIITAPFKSLCALLVFYHIYVILLSLSDYSRCGCCYMMAIWGRGERGEW